MIHLPRTAHALDFGEMAGERYRADAAPAPSGAHQRTRTRRTRARRMRPPASSLQPRTGLPRRRWHALTAASPLPQSARRGPGRGDRGRRGRRAMSAGHPHTTLPAARGPRHAHQHPHRPVRPRDGRGAGRIRRRCDAGRGGPGRTAVPSPRTGHHPACSLQARAGREPHCRRTTARARGIGGALRDCGRGHPGPSSRPLTPQPSVLADSLSVLLSFPPSVGRRSQQHTVTRGPLTAERRERTGPCRGHIGKRIRHRNVGAPRVETRIPAAPTASRPVPEGAAMATVLRLPDHRRGQENRKELEE